MRLQIRQLRRLWRDWNKDLARELVLVAGEPKACNDARYWLVWQAANTIHTQRDDTFVVLASVVLEGEGTDVLTS